MDKKTVGAIAAGGVLGALIVFFLMNADLFRQANPYVLEKVTVGKVNSLTQDAAKRSILVYENGILCAEPPPDVIGTVAGQVSAQLAAKRNDQNFNASTLQEVSTAIEALYNRSQGIQAMRDAMYRLCEALGNQAIDRDFYQRHIIYLLGTLNFVVPTELCTSLLERRELIGEGQAKALFDACASESKDFALRVIKSAVFSDLERRLGQETAERNAASQVGDSASTQTAPK